MKGQCLCGAITITTNGEPVMMSKCHCRDCQYISGGEASPLLFFPMDNVEIQGTASTFEKKADSGKGVERSFCPKCGTHVYSKAEAAPDMIFVKAGTIDRADLDAADVQTAMVFYAASAQPFSHIDEDAQVFETSPS